jgi:hypothetical protein
MKCSLGDSTALTGSTVSGGHCEGHSPRDPAQRVVLPGAHSYQNPSKRRVMTALAKVNPPIALPRVGGFLRRALTGQGGEIREHTAGWRAHVRQPVSEYQPTNRKQSS